MKLTNIKISGYKSIDELEFSIEKHGKSYTTILLGKNETGKSNVLDAIAMVEQADNKITEGNYTRIRNKKTKPKKVSVFFDFLVEDSDNYRDVLLNTSNMEIPESLVNSILIKKVIKESYLKDGDDKYDVDFEFICNKITKLDAYGMLINKEEIPATPTVPPRPAKIVENFIIKKMSEITDKEESEKYLLLNEEWLNKILKKALLDFVIEKTHTVIDRWKSEPKYLIQDKIKLDEFVQGRNNIPLENIFYLAGYGTYDDIAKVAEEIKKDENERRSLSTNLTAKATEYIRKKWKEHKVKVDVEVGNDYTVKVSIQDEADSGSYYDMEERSQGFKQFASLLFSISVGSASGNVKNHIILIDEPEVHLHPSGIRYMKDELLRIGENNYLFISTHSNFMMDIKEKERHHILTKGDDNSTNKEQIKTEENIDDEVLQTAFGINVISDFLSPHKLLVEGADDKKLLEKALSKIKPDNDIRITNGNGSNIVTVASRLAFHDIKPMVISDDDKDGRRYREEIKKIGKNDFADNVFTLFSFNSGITEKGTIEDSLPILFVQNEANSILHDNGIADITLKVGIPFCEQISLHLQKVLTDVNGKKKTEKVNGLLALIKGKTVNYPLKDIDATNSPILYKLAEEILSKFNISVN